MGEEEQGVLESDYFWEPIRRTLLTTDKTRDLEVCGQTLHSPEFLNSIWHTVGALEHELIKAQQ